jgi:hypothetical protein
LRQLRVLLWCWWPLALPCLQPAADSHRAEAVQPGLFKAWKV